MSLWDVANSRVVQANAGDYLSRNLGWALSKKRDVESISALTDPKQFVTDRQTKVDAIVTGKVQPFFEARLKEYYDLGLPDEVAKEMALNHAKTIYNQQLEMLEIGAPNAYRQAFGLGQIEQQTNIDKLNVADIEKRAIKNYKQKKRAVRK